MYQEGKKRMTRRRCHQGRVNILSGTPEAMPCLTVLPSLTRVLVKPVHCSERGISREQHGLKWPQAEHIEVHVDPTVPAVGNSIHTLLSINVFNTSINTSLSSHSLQKPVQVEVAHSVNTFNVHVVAVIEGKKARKLPSDEISVVFVSPKPHTPIQRENGIAALMPGTLPERERAILPRLVQPWWDADVAIALPSMRLRSNCRRAS